MHRRAATPLTQNVIVRHAVSSSCDAVQAFAGLGLKNSLELNVGLFSGLFEIDIDNWAAARAYLFGFKFDFLDIKVRWLGWVACFVLDSTSDNANAGVVLCVLSRLRSTPAWPRLRPAPPT